MAGKMRPGGCPGHGANTPCGPPAPGTRGRRHLPLFRIADDSEQAVAAYLALGTVLVATDLGELVGHAQMIPHDAPATWELKSLAVMEAHRHGGVGRRLVEAGLEHANRQGARRVVVSTAAADTGVLRFYQRLGFRLTRIDPDIFTPEAGYPPSIYIDGIQLLDRAWLEIAV